MNKKIKFGFAILLTSLGLAAVLIYRSIPAKLPLISGSVIPQAKSLNEFTILDHHNREFTRQNLLGKWHLISYGYTNCPDICPNTLNVLARVVEKLEQQNQYSDLAVLFYSIDHQRDTAEHLAQYMPFFNDTFVGLTYTNEMQAGAVAFEESLSLVSRLMAVDDPANPYAKQSYQVAHGVMLYLLNPQGQLQAVLKPTQGKGGIQFYTTEQVYQDYLAIRRYFG